MLVQLFWSIYSFLQCRMRRDTAERWLWGKHLEEITLPGSKGSLCSPEGPPSAPQSKQTILGVSHCIFFCQKPTCVAKAQGKGVEKGEKMKLKEAQKMTQNLYVNKKNHNMIIILHICSILNIIPLNVAVA